MPDLTPAAAIDRLREHDKAMTPGEWKHFHTDGQTGWLISTVYQAEFGRTYSFPASCNCGMQPNELNAAGIAWMRNNAAAIADLLAGLERDRDALAARVRELEADAEDVRQSRSMNNPPQDEGD